MEAARTVLVGSHHTGREPLGDGRPARPRGEDPPRPSRRRRRGVLAAARRDRRRRHELERLAGRLEQRRPGGLGRDLELAAAGIRSYAAAEGPRVVFVGKLIVSKGCDLLLAAWPLVARGHPGARLMMVGFGEYRDGLLRLWAALSLRRPRRRPRGRPPRLGARGRGGGAAHLPVARSSPIRPTATPTPPAAAAGTHRLRRPARVRARSPTSSAAATRWSCPSTFPEAFGMVAAEAASTGALPVCADHSGLAEVAGALAGGAARRASAS